MPWSWTFNPKFSALITLALFELNDTYLNWFELVWTSFKECFELAVLDLIYFQSCLFWSIWLKSMKKKWSFRKNFNPLCKKVSYILLKWTMENDLVLWIEWGWAEAQWGQKFFEINFKFLFSTTISWYRA